MKVNLFFSPIRGKINSPKKPIIKKKIGIDIILNSGFSDNNNEITDIVPSNNVEVLLKAILKENQNIAHENFWAHE